MRKYSVVSVLSMMVMLFVAMTGSRAVEVKAQPAQPGFKPVVRFAEKQDISQPLREMAMKGSTAPVDSSVGGRPALRLPKASAPAIDADLLILPAAPVSTAMPAVQASFEGVQNVDGVLPPDTNGDIGYDPVTGKKWYFQWVNLSFNIWDVTNPSAPVAAYPSPRPGNVLWTGFGGPCETTNHGDPIVIFDQFANRWNASQFSVIAPNFYQCIAISQTADPTGAWYRYGFKISSTKMNDYPKLGVWPDGYYMSINQFEGGVWAGAGAVAFERDKMLLGQAARMVIFDLYGVNEDFGGMLPSDADGDLPPPTGAPNVFAEWDDSSWIGPEDALRLWNFHVDWVNPANSTFGVNGQPNQIIATQNVNLLLQDVPQPDTSVDLDTLADRLMHRLQYRNFGTYQALVTNHTVNAGSGRAGIHWWELRKTSGNWAIQQEGIHAPADALHRWMGSIAMDASGNLALGYSTSGENAPNYPSIAYAGRLTTDPVNTLPQAEIVMKAGTGSQTNPAPNNRWGDYSMMSVDPNDGCTFWYTNEYLVVKSTAAWHTWIGSFRFPGCVNSTLGLLSGTVKVSGTTTPIVGAKVSINSMDGYTNSNGEYAINVTPGTFSVTASAYGYLTQTVNNVVITSENTTVLNFSLSPAPVVTVQGKVSDNSGHVGMPLYARVEITGYPGGAVYTNPFTGMYSAQLFQDTPYVFTVSAVMGGYGAPVTRPVTPPAGGKTENFGLAVDSSACNAPGYQITGGIFQNFDGSTTPAGWTVVDHMVPPEGQVWVFNDPGVRGNLTGGSGHFAIIDSDNYGSGNEQDTSLISPVINFSGVGSVNLAFKTYYYSGVYDTADVDVSSDGGVNWTNVWHQDATVAQYSTININISASAANKSNVKVRFHYTGVWDWYWQVDDVVIGAPVCSTIAGGLVGGYVKDANTDAGLVGAAISGGSAPVTSFATPQDVSLGDGFYQVFAPSATSSLTAAVQGGYLNETKSVLVVANLSTQLDFNLKAGQLAFSPAALTIPVGLNAQAARSVNLVNSGGAAATFSLTEATGLPSQPQVTGPFAVPGRRVSPKRLYELSAESVRVYEPPTAAEWGGGAQVNAWNSGLVSPWGVGITQNGQVWVSSAALGGGDDLNHRFNRQGGASGVTANTQGWVGAFAGDMALDVVSGKLWQVNVGGDACLYELDVHGAEFTGVKICPQFGSTARGLAFDALNRTFFAGGWVDGIISHFDEEGRLLDSINTALNISGMAVNPMTGHLFVMNNANAGYDIYVFDTRSGYALLGGFDIAGMSDYGQAGLELDAQGRLWAVDQKAGMVYVVESGEREIYAFADVTWLEVLPISGGVSAGGLTALEVRINTTGLAAGVYTAHLLVGEDTPYTVTPLVVSIQVGHLTHMPFIGK